MYRQTARSWLAPGRFALAIALGLVGCHADEWGSPHGRAGAPRAIAVKPFALGRPDLVLLVTGGAGGVLEVCNCSGPMPGGLARRSGLVRSYRAAADNTFLIDTGDCFWVEPEDIRNGFLLKGYSQIGYDAVVLGDQEWAAAPLQLARMLVEAPLPYLATTVRSAAVESADPRASALLKTAVLRDATPKLAAVAYVPRDAFWLVPKPRTESLAFQPPEELAALVRRLKADGYLVVLVAHADVDDLPDVAGRFDADLILLGHTRRCEERPLHVSGKPVIKVGGNEFVGVVALKVQGGRIAALEYRVELVTSHWPLDGRLIQTYQAYAHAAMRQALDAEKKQGVDYVASASCGQCHPGQYQAWKRGPHARAYRALEKVRRTGDPNCLMCHTSGFGTVKGFHTIRKTPELAGVNCQDCHRFGMAEHRQRTAATRRAPTPASSASQDGNRKRTPSLELTLPKPFAVLAKDGSRVPEDVCTTCHTPVTAPRFDYRTMLPKVKCPSRGR